MRKRLRNLGGKRHKFKAELSKIDKPANRIMFKDLIHIGRKSDKLVTKHVWVDIGDWKVKGMYPGKTIEFTAIVKKYTKRKPGTQSKKKPKWVKDYKIDEIHDVNLIK